MSIFSNFDELYKVFIRPGRSEYGAYDLGPKKAQYGKYTTKRHDFSMKNKQGLNLECSFYEPLDKTIKNFDEQQKQFPCVIYCHCNSGSKLEGMPHIEPLVSRGIGIFLFDFAGSGNSQGDYISLGWNEAEDLQTVINYLRNCGRVSQIGLWGRSMGAVTILLYAVRDPRITCILSDSPFLNLRQLAREAANEKSSLIPNFLVDMLLDKIRKQILENANFDIDHITIKDRVQKLRVPIMCVCSKEDTFVRWHHTETIYDQYAGDQKRLYFVGGSHNAPREPQFEADAAEFFLQQFIQKAESQQRKKKVSTYTPDTTGMRKNSSSSIESNGQQQNNNTSNNNQQQNLQKLTQTHQKVVTLNLNVGTPKNSANFNNNNNINNGPNIAGGKQSNSQKNLVKLQQPNITNSPQIVPSSSSKKQQYDLSPQPINRKASYSNIEGVQQNQNAKSQQNYQLYQQNTYNNNNYVNKIPSRNSTHIEGSSNNNLGGVKNFNIDRFLKNSNAGVKNRGTIANSQGPIGSSNMSSNLMKNNDNVIENEENCEYSENDEIKPNQKMAQNFLKKLNKIDVLNPVQQQEQSYTSSQQSTNNTTSQEKLQNVNLNQQQQYNSTQNTQQVNNQKTGGGKFQIDKNVFQSFQNVQIPVYQYQNSQVQQQTNRGYAHQHQTPSIMDLSKHQSSLQNSPKNYNQAGNNKPPLPNSPGSVSNRLTNGSNHNNSSSKKSGFAQFRDIRPSPQPNSNQYQDNVNQTPPMNNNYTHRSVSPNITYKSYNKSHNVSTNQQITSKTTNTTTTQIKYNNYSNQNCSIIQNVIRNQQQQQSQQQHQSATQNNTINNNNDSGNNFLKNLPTNIFMTQAPYQNPLNIQPQQLQSFTSNNTNNVNFSTLPLSQQTQIAEKIQQQSSQISNNTNNDVSPRNYTQNLQTNTQNTLSSTGILDSHIQSQQQQQIVSINGLNMENNNNNSNNENQGSFVVQNQSQENAQNDTNNNDQNNLQLRKMTVSPQSARNLNSGCQKDPNQSPGFQKFTSHLHNIKETQNQISKQIRQTNISNSNINNIQQEHRKRTSSQFIPTNSQQQQLEKSNSNNQTSFPNMRKQANDQQIKKSGIYKINNNTPVMNLHIQKGEINSNNSIKGSSSYLNSPSNNSKKSNNNSKQGSPGKPPIHNSHNNSKFHDKNSNLSNRGGHFSGSSKQSTPDFKTSMASSNNTNILNQNSFFPDEIVKNTEDFKQNNINNVVQPRNVTINSNNNNPNMINQFRKSSVQNNLQQLITNQYDLKYDFAKENSNDFGNQQVYSSMIESPTTYRNNLMLQEQQQQINNNQNLVQQQQQQVINNRKDDNLLKKEPQNLVSTVHRRHTSKDLENISHILLQQQQQSIKQMGALNTENQQFLQNQQQQQKNPENSSQQLQKLNSMNNRINHQQVSLTQNQHHLLPQYQHVHHPHHTNSHIQHSNNNQQQQPVTTQPSSSIKNQLQQQQQQVQLQQQQQQQQPQRYSMGTSNTINNNINNQQQQSYRNAQTLGPNNANNQTQQSEQQQQQTIINNNNSQNIANVSQYSQQINSIQQQQEIKQQQQNNNMLYGVNKEAFNTYDNGASNYQKQPQQQYVVPNQPQQYGQYPQQQQHNMGQSTTQAQNNIYNNNQQSQQQQQQQNK